MTDRLSRAREVARQRGIEALLVGIGPDLRYLSGYEAIETERLTMLVVTTSEPGSVLVVPRIEEPAARAGLLIDIPIVAWNEATEGSASGDPYGIVEALVAPALSRPAARIAVSDRLWASHLLRLQAGALRSARFEPGSPVLSELRMVKDPHEIDALRRAARAADRVIDQVAHGSLVGRTEVAVSREIRDRLVAEGHQTAEFAIVAGGPNGASPHHQPSDRPIQAGEPVVLDIGGTLDGYGSDITRTVWVTGGEAAAGPTPEFREVYELVRTAQAEATAAAHPGATCEGVDRVARDIIAAGGLGDRFIHRTGHGIGLEGHEDPYIVAGNQRTLEPGMTFSIEPGIYIDGRFGVRIEDIVVCTPDGPVSLNETPRELMIVDG